MCRDPGAEPGADAGVEVAGLLMFSHANSLGRLEAGAGLGGTPTGQSGVAGLNPVESAGHACR